jgi:hypothetical protein
MPEIPFQGDKLGTIQPEYRRRFSLFDRNITFLSSVRMATLAVILSFFSVILVHSQGTIEVLQTGGGGPLVSREVPLVMPEADTNVLVTFDFGFATDEFLDPEAFLDSLTASLSSQNNQNFLPLFTIDASGVVWLPTGGNVVLSDSDLQRMGIDFPSGPPTLTQRSAWHVEVVVPSVFLDGNPVSLFFDLFDNGNPVASAGWFRDVTLVVVPEPGVGALAVFGIVVMQFIRRGRTRR